MIGVAPMADSGNRLDLGHEVFHTVASVVYVPGGHRNGAILV